MHPRNKNIQDYNLDKLVQVVPELSKHIITSKTGKPTVAFANPDAVRLLNKALLLHDYQLEFWTIAKTNLCPPVPGRADYIHYVADVLAENSGEIPTGKRVKILDIGTGASLIYPIIGVTTYNWEFVCSEVDKASITNVNMIIERNKILKQNVTVRLQDNKRNILKGVLLPGEYYDFVICNPPFYKSKEEATFQNNKKSTNLGLKTNGKATPNFSGQNNELWYEGGEKAFITNMIYESVHFKGQSLWFSSLVSNKDSLKTLNIHLKKVNVKESRIIEMKQGNKISRILLWNF
ncbi:23S rRNA (adenine(1618)-N(6))-methyltransferase RlmF [Flavobacterium agricola]|uniref:23S rRNA (Adenine(1618)-N(6))-methyltransferase RlmF n=1 Tax=Flavobacterium agricola TaxID=2870839 RepID=A0ABY6M0I4_9FLAO|nr:23S rRNA (adenine(1618)-N(6))-methyltransferase RlmF [Flavobacterium agricola]UYW00383.1 23S rRNA (adenine(1618)-N(6))-methyltransferase RlmF [Flavobacterium agricola]